jgi:hypothetical protein
MANYTDKQLIEKIVNYTDMEELELLEAATFDSVAWGACRSCGAVSEPHEPDADENWCEECGENAVASVLILAGMI